MGPVNTTLIVPLSIDLKKLCHLDPYGTKLINIYLSSSFLGDELNPSNRSWKCLLPKESKSEDSWSQNGKLIVKWYTTTGNLQKFGTLRNSNLLEYSQQSDGAYYL